MSLRRPDWLAELQSVLLAAMVLTSAVIAFGLIAPAADDAVTFTVPAVAVDGLTDVLVTGPSAYQRLLHVLTGLPSYAVGLVMLMLLWSTVRLARRTGPFEQPVVRRLTWLGFVVVAGGLLADAVQLTATFLASETVLDGHLSASYALSWWWLLAGIGFLAVAELVKRGAAMRAELDAVV